MMTPIKPSPRYAMNLNRFLTALLCLGAILLFTGQSPVSKSTEKNRLAPAVWKYATVPLYSNY